MSRRNRNRPYKRGVDVPAWLFQIASCLVLIGFSLYLIVSLRSERLDVGAAIYIAFSAITIVLDLWEMYLMRRRAMPPELYLAFASVKTLLWLVILALRGLGLDIIGVVIALVLFIASVPQLTQGAWIIHKKRKKAREDAEVEEEEEDRGFEMTG